MDLTDIDLTRLDPRIQAAILTGGLALIGWVVQSFVMRPVDDSRQAFFHLLNKRVEICSQVRSYLAMIDLFRDQPDECARIKERLQDLLLGSGLVGYLDQVDSAELMEIAVRSDTDADKVRRLLQRMNRNLSQLAEKVEQDTSFYARYYHPDPAIRLWRMALLVLRGGVLVACALMLGYWLMLQLVSISWLQRVVVVIVGIVVAWQAKRLYQLFRFTTRKK